jgi:hypothetical protein
MACGKLTPQHYASSLLETHRQKSILPNKTNRLARPDHCNGGFDQFCDNKRSYNNISLILVDAGRGDLLDYMKEYWKDYKGDDESLYSHEFSKHGTCVSTLEPKCYTDYYPQEEVVDYFNKTVEIFQRLPSYEVRIRCIQTNQVKNQA